MHLRDGLQTHRTIADRYANAVEAGSLKADPAQMPVVAALDRLMADISTKRLAQKSSALGWLFAGKRAARTPVKGIYLHGGVGRGKTMLMDWFFDLVPVRRKRRVHFNAFMAEVHDRIQRHRQARKEGLVREDDPMPPVARDLAGQAWVLCFDEFAVTDIADAMILSRLFSALFENGVVLVATSNVAPDDLYRDGLNRQLFEPFIALLKQNAEIVALVSPTDHRMEKLARMGVYMAPLSAETDRRMDEAWEAMTRRAQAVPAEIAVKGRQVAVPLSADGAARFAFGDLCEKPLAARDYIAIANRYPTVFVDRVPVLGEGRRNEAKRFILLIDTLYDSGTRLVMSAEAAPDRLYAGRAGTEVFEFARTASRLNEMQGRDWLDAWAERQAAAPGQPAGA